MSWLRTAAASASRAWITVAGFVLGLDAIGWTHTAQSLLSNWRVVLAVVVSAAIKGAAKAAWEAFKAALAGNRGELA